MFTIHKCPGIHCIPGITTEQPVRAERPQVSHMAYRLFSELRYFISWIFFVVDKIAQERVDFCGLKSGDADIKLAVGQKISQLAEFGRESCAILTCVSGDFVIG
jgi:hypothetical protein